MDVSLLIKVSGVCLLVAAAYQILNRAGREEQAMLLSITGTVIILIVIIERVGELFDSIRSIFGL